MQVFNQISPNPSFIMLPLVAIKVNLLLNHIDIEAQSMQPVCDSPWQKMCFKWKKIFIRATDSTQLKP